MYVVLALAPRLQEIMKGGDILEVDPQALLSKKIGHNFSTRSQITPHGILKLTNCPHHCDRGRILVAKIGGIAQPNSNQPASYLFLGKRPVDARAKLEAKGFSRTVCGRRRPRIKLQTEEATSW